MKTYTTYFDAHFHGFNNIKEIHRLRTEARELARVKQEIKQADHMIYCHYDLDIYGDISTVFLYSGLPMTNDEFERVAAIPNSFIGAIHKREQLPI